MNLDGFFFIFSAACCCCSFFGRDLFVAGCFVKIRSRFLVPLPAFRHDFVVAVFACGRDCHLLVT